MSRAKFGRVCVLIGLGGLAMANATQAGVVTFDQPTDLANNFVVNNQTGTGGYVPVTGGGVGNTGALDVTAGPSTTLDATAVYTPQSFNPQNGTITISQYVKVQATPTIGDRLIHLGIIDDPAATHQLNGGAPAHADFISARVFPQTATVAGATTTPYTYQVQSGNSVDSPSAATATTNNPGTIDPAANFNLTHGDWYLFTVNINRTATANTFSVNSTLQDFGTDGLTPGTTVTFGPLTLNANTTDIYNDTQVYGAFRAHGNAGGADLLDTFSVSQNTPEPSALCFLGLGAISLLARRRKA